MRDRFLEVQYGHYEPAFFRMHIAIKEKIEHIDKLSPAAFATLIHEYVHFIQDVTTLYGLGNIYNTVEFIKYATNQIYTEGQSFTVPIMPDTSTFNGSMISFSSELERITLGSTSAHDNVRLLHGVKKYVPIQQHLDMKKMFVWELKVNGDTKFGAFNYQFGAGCIMESMAYILEKKLSGVDEDLPDLPYNSAKLVADKIYKGFSHNPLRLLALCDISLNCSNPAKAFTDLLIEWKHRNIKPHNARELYDDFYKHDYLFSEETPVRVTKKIVKFYDEFTQYVKIARESLHYYFRPKETTNEDDFTIQMSLLNQWINEIMDSALKWRKDYPSFIIDLAEGGQDNNTSLVALYNDFGLPFCTNDNDEGCFYHPRIQTKKLQLNIFLAIGQIYRLLKKGKDVPCKLFNYCKKCEVDKTGDITPNESCYAPWNRDNDDKLCPYAMLWKHWNLTGRKPKFLD